MTGAALVTHNSSADLPACLASLPRDWPLVVVDNASTDGSAALARERAPHAQVIENRENRGYGAALNQALEVLDSELVVLANPDVVFGAGSLEAMVGFLEGHPQHALAGPDGSARGFPTVTLEACELFFGHRLWPDNPVHGRFFRTDLAGRDGDCDWVVGACVVARRAALAGVGGFDEGYHLYFEETDLAWRLARAGWRCAQVGAARIAHAGGGSSRGREEELARVYLQSQQRFFRKKDGAPAAALLRAVQVLGNRFRLVVRAGRELLVPVSIRRSRTTRASARQPSE